MTHLPSLPPQCRLIHCSFSRCARLPVHRTALAAVCYLRCSFNVTLSTLLQLLSPAAATAAPQLRPNPLQLRLFCFYFPVLIVPNAKLQELAQLLSEPLRPGFSQKYFTGGAAGAAAMLQGSGAALGEAAQPGVQAADKLLISCLLFAN